MPSDRDLIEQLRAGHASAFEALFERYAPQVRRRLMRVVRDDAAAEDLLQEVFLRLWTGAESWQGTGRLGNYLLRMATNLALNYLRAIRRDRQTALPTTYELDEQDDDNGEPDWLSDAAAVRPDQVAQQNERRETVRTLIEHLPPRQQQVIRMLYQSGLGVDEIARRLAIPPGTVKSRLHAARAALARAWEQLLEEQDEP